MIMHQLIKRHLGAFITNLKICKMKKLYYFTALIAVSLFLWYHTIFTLNGDAAGFVGFAAFCLDVMAVVELHLEDNE